MESLINLTRIPSGMGGQGSLDRHMWDLIQTKNTVKGQS